MSTPVMVMSTHFSSDSPVGLPADRELLIPRNTDAPAPQRQSGRKAQISNIMAAKTVADVLRTVLGPKAMLKMVRPLLIEKPARSSELTSKRSSRSWTLWAAFCERTV